MGIRRSKTRYILVYTLGTHHPGWSLFATRTPIKLNRQLRIILRNLRKKRMCVCVYYTCVYTYKYTYICCQNPPYKMARRFCKARLQFILIFSATDCSTVILRLIRCSVEILGQPRTSQFHIYTIQAWNIRSYISICILCTV